MITGAFGYLMTFLLERNNRIFPHKAFLFGMKMKNLHLRSLHEQTGKKRDQLRE